MINKNEDSDWDNYDMYTNTIIDQLKNNLFNINIVTNEQ